MNPRAATFQDSAGRIVGATWGGTICWYPRKQSKLVAVSERGDREHVIRCGWCPGCRELDRRRLADRLVKWSEKIKGSLWLVIIQARLTAQSSQVARMRRTASLARSSGFYRLDEREFAIIVAGPKPRICWRGSLKSVAVEIRPIARSRGRRAFNLVTSGILRSRDLWGEWTKRFYHRGLPKADRDRWLVSTAGGIRKRHAATGIGVRGVVGDVSLYPPAAWLPPRLARRGGPIDRRTRDPIQVGNVVTELLDRIRREPVRNSQSPAISRARQRASDAGSDLPMLAGGGGTARDVAPLRQVSSKATPTARPPSSKTGSIRMIETGYKGSQHSRSADIDAWSARMLEIAKRRRKDQGPPDD